MRDNAIPSGSGGSPVHWPSLSAEEAAYEWDDLDQWVAQYVQRYPAAASVPDCWYQHSHFVELLSALRDHERASFTRAAPGTAAMEWQHARSLAETQLDLWRRRLSCSVSDRKHPRLSDGRQRSEWLAFVQKDVERRRAYSASSSPGSPTPDP